MENPVPEGMTFTYIRQTIRRVILPLVQTIYDENPTDIILFCSDYFNDLLQKREKDLENLENQDLKCVDESIQKMEDGMENQNELKKMDDFHTNIQGSSSAPHLTTDKQAMVVNLRGTSSWDTPSNIIEPIKSLAVLKDAVCGIGDQPSSGKKLIGLKNDSEVDDANTFLKDDSVCRCNSFTEDKIVNETKNYSAGEEDRNENTEEDLQTLCTKFEGMTTFEISGTPKFNDAKHNDFDLQSTQMKDRTIYRKELSPNSSFGFIPRLNEYGSEGKMEKMNSENYDTEDFQAETEKIKAFVTEISETFSNLADKINSSEANFNDKFQTANEISDVIEGRNIAGEMNFDIKSDPITDSKSYSIEKKNNDIITKDSDKWGLDSEKNENNTRSREIKEEPSSLQKADKNTHEHFNLEEKFKERQATKRDLIEQMNSQKENFSDKKNLVTQFLDDKDDDEDGNDQTDYPESENIVDKTWRKKWYEAHPPLDNLDGVQRMRRYPTLNQEYFTGRRPNIGEAGDVPHDEFHNPNSSSRDWRSKNQVTSESSTCITERSYSRFSSDEINDRTVRGRPSDNLPKRKLSNEKISNANIQIVPYSWRKSGKQTHSLEDLGNYSKASEFNEGTVHSITSARKENISKLAGTEKTTEIDMNENKETTLEASDEIQDQSAAEKNKNWEQSTTESDMDEKTKNSDHNETLSEVLKAKKKNQRNGHLIKDELVLNAACGDFIRRTSDTNELNIDSQTCLMTLEENNEKSRGISKEYCEEVIERVIEQQKNDSKDLLDVLNFSCYSGSDSSYTETSDYSEADDFDMNDSLQES